MRRSILYMAVMVAGILQVSAQNYSRKDTVYRPLIREDRVWEYTAGDSTEQYRFVGTTDRDGKTYHRFCRVRVEIVKDGEKIVTNDTVCKGLMREDEKLRTVYSLKENGDSVRELLLYDFEMGKDDMSIYVDIYNSKIENHYQTFPILDEYDGILCLKSCGLYHKGKITERILMPESEIFHYPELTFVEGIGPAEIRGIGGILSHPLYGMEEKLIICGKKSAVTAEGGTRSVSRETVRLLQKVYDGDMKAIFDPKDVKEEFGPDEGIPDASLTEGIMISMGVGNIVVRCENRVGMTVWSMQGSKVAGAEGAGEVSVSTSGLVPGVYVVRAASADGRSTTRKIVVK